MKYTFHYRVLFMALLLLVGGRVSAGSAGRVSVETLLAHWEDYVGKRVVIEEPLLVCGVFYDSLLLSTSPLFVPEEQAVGLSKGDSTRYYELQSANRYRTIALSAKYSPHKIIVGSQLQHLEAIVTSPGHLLTGRTPRFSHNKASEKLPSLGRGANMRICSANIQNYFYHLGGYAGAKTEEQFARQTQKIVKGLVHLDADIYALCELEKGSTAPRHLVEAMNRSTHSSRYEFVNFGHKDADTISVGYIYRKDRVRPYGPTSYAYEDTLSKYHYRFIAQGFEHLASGERLVLCTNHLRSKYGPPSFSDSIRVSNVDSLLQMLRSMERDNRYGDSDLLLLGDYNCYTQERPIQRIIEAGYEDVLMHYASGGYSYNYKGYCGYLDRAFASPSMAAQLTMVQPVHLNTDYFYSLGYKKKYNQTMHRYSDHDPLLIGVRLGEQTHQKK